MPQESNATCGECIMCPANRVGRPTAVATFDPTTKCCTYLPMLRNFHVGSVLADDDPAMDEGRATLEARLDAGIGVTPVGLQWPASFERQYDEDLSRDFGRRRDMRCPHYLDRDGGLCGIWKHRNAVCSTWFCSYERGEKGQVYWEALYELLSFVEEILSWDVLRALGIGEEAIALMESDDDGRGLLDGSTPITEEMRRALWGVWFGREREFYREAAAKVAAMAWSDVARLGGGRLARKLEAVEEALEDLGNTRLPPFVAHGSLSILDEDEEGAWVRSYRAYDALYLTQDQLAVIRGLNINAMEDVVERLEVYGGGGVTPAWLRQLVDMGVLRAALPPFEPGDGP